MSVAGQTFQGRHVRIEPLLPRHAAELWPAVDDDAIRLLWPRSWTSEADVRAQFQALQDDPDAEGWLVRDAATGEAVGSTAYYDVHPQHRHLSIGWTFYVRSHRRTGANTETKLILLREAFEGRRLERVQFDVDGRNVRSQEAVLRLGAVREGVLRRHKVLHDGFVRDTHVFSILRAEWPTVRENLEARLARGP